MKDKKNNIFSRIGAYIIDIVIVTLLCSLISNIRFLNPYYDEYTEASLKYSEYYSDYVNEKIELEEFNKKIEPITRDLYKYGTSNYIIALITIVGYFGVFQKYNNGQTIGKRILKLKVVSFEDKEVPLYLMILRIIPMVLIGYGGIFSLMTCILIPHLLTNNVELIISSMSIINTLLGFIDAEVAIVRKDKRALHDLLSKTKVIESN